MSKQSSIDWLKKQYYQSEGKLTRYDFEQAKEMHKEEVKEAFKHGELPPLFVNFNAEQYYNETFGGES
jgi:hypothetical protein